MWTWNDFVFVRFNGLLGWAILLCLHPVMIARALKEKKQETLQKVILTIILLLIIDIIAVVIFLVLPIWLSWMLPVSFSWIYPAGLWIALLGAAGLVVYLVYSMSNRYGERRGLYSSLGHLGIILLGWLLGRWMGIIFISVPLLFIYYLILYWFATVLIPANNPDSKIVLLDGKNEKWQRFLISIWYTWGLQYPMNVVLDEWGRDMPPTRIPGSPFRKVGEPGIILTRAHQVVGITAGTDFSRVEGPGIVFTKRFERPQEIVDLRRQVRVSWINALTKDGIQFRARLFMVFKINDSFPDYSGGSFQYSQKWVRRLLKLTGVMQTRPDKKENTRWDDMVVKQIEQAAQHTLAKRTLNELWQAQDSTNFDSAFVEIKEQIKSSLQQRLEHAGITLFTSAMPSFGFPEETEEKDDSIPSQQLKTWQSFWAQQANQTIAEGDAEAVRLEEEARVYAQSILLKALAEGIKQTKEEMSQYVIAIRFIGAIQELMKREPTVAEKVGTEISSQLENIKHGISSQ